MHWMNLSRKRKIWHCQRKAEKKRMNVKNEWEKYCFRWFDASFECTRHDFLFCFTHSNVNYSENVKTALRQHSYICAHAMDTFHLKNFHQTCPVCPLLGKWSFRSRNENDPYVTRLLFTLSLSLNIFVDRRGSGHIEKLCYVCEKFAIKIQVLLHVYFMTPSSSFIPESVTFSFFFSLQFVSLRFFLLLFNFARIKWRVAVCFHLTSLTLEEKKHLI